MEVSGDNGNDSSQGSCEQVPFRQLSSGIVSEKKDHKETNLPQISISNDLLSKSPRKSVSLIHLAVSSNESRGKSLDPDQDADPGHIKTQFSAVNGDIIPIIITYSMHITFEDQVVLSNDVNFSIRPNHLPSYEDITAKSEEYVNAQFGPMALAGRSNHFCCGMCTITSKDNNKSFGHIHTQAISTDADWRDICSFLATLKDQGIHLDIYREYSGLPIQTVPFENLITRKQKEIYNLMKSCAFNEKYLPRSYLSKVVSESVVRDIISDDTTVPPAEKELFIQKVWDRAPKLFAMCVVAGLKMRCLKEMLEKGQDDNTSPLEEQHCCHELCKQEFENSLPYYRRLNAATFFCAGEHQELSYGTVLPIYFQAKAMGRLTSAAQDTSDASDKEIENDEEYRDSSDQEQALCGSGAYSNVYRVRLDPAHHNLAKDEKPVFALKIFRDRPGRTEGDFKKELDLLNALLEYEGENEHIVHHLATWIQDRRYYMLFPYAECNLRQYMEHHSFASPTKKSVLWLLAQFLGLSSGLRGIHQLSDPETSTGLLPPQKPPRQSGWHHDLKPENILYFKALGPKADSFKIADFGSGKVHTYRSGTGSHNTGSPNGTLTYEPPEAMKEGKTSRPYDVWSMGCVFVEMLIWAVYDYDSVKSFADSRQGKRSPDHYITDDAFWQMGIDGNPKRRPSVDDWLGKLGEKLQGWNLQTLQRVLDLVHRMLDPNRQTRITALHLWDTLLRINKQTEIDLQAYTDDILIGQSTIRKTRRHTLSLSTKEPDR